MIHIDFAYHSILSCLVSNSMPFVCLHNGPIVRYNHLLFFLELLKLVVRFYCFKIVLCLELCCLIVLFSFLFMHEVIASRLRGEFMIETGLIFKRIQHKVFGLNFIGIYTYIRSSQTSLIASKKKCRTMAAKKKKFCIFINFLVN